MAQGNDDTNEIKGGELNTIKPIAIWHWLGTFSEFPNASFSYSLTLWVRGIINKLSQEN